MKLLAIFLAGIAAIAIACGNGGNDEARFPVEITDDRVSSGEVIYEENCASCHGQPGVSRPPVQSAPPHDETGHTWHHADRLLFQWILDKPPLATLMPAFRGQLTEEEVLSVLAYIKSTWPEDVREWQREGSEQYEAQLRESP